MTALRQGVVPQHESAWLYKIAHNVCLSRRLAATRRARVETPRDLSLIQDEVGGPVRSHDELIGLDDVLAEMPERLRTAFLMREWQGLSYHEIADELGISHSAVETLIFRARRHLAKALETGTEKTRAARRALDFGGVLAGLKALLGGGAAVKAAVAAVAVVVAAGGVAGGRALADSSRPAADSRAQLLFADALAASPVVEGMTRAAEASAASDSASAAGAAAPATRSVVLLEPESDAGASRGAPAAQQAAAVSGAVVPPGATAPPDGRAGSAAPEEGFVGLPAVTPPATPPPATATPVPPAPSVQMPPAPVVSVATPTVEAPTLATPTVQTPTVEAPSVQTPTVQTPTVQTPTVQTPTVQTPTVQTPTVQTPTVQTPSVQTPTVPSVP